MTCLHLIAGVGLKGLQFEGRSRFGTETERLGCGCGRAFFCFYFYCSGLGEIVGQGKAGIRGQGLGNRDQGSGFVSDPKLTQACVPRRRDRAHIRRNMLRTEF